MSIQSFCRISSSVDVVITVSAARLILLDCFYIFESQIRTYLTENISKQ